MCIRDRVCTKEELDEVTMKFAKKLAAGPLLSYKNIKKQVYDAAYADYKKWLDETEIPTQRAVSYTHLLHGRPLARVQPHS